MKEQIEEDENAAEAEDDEDVAEYYKDEDEDDDNSDNEKGNIADNYTRICIRNNCRVTVIYVFKRKQL